MRCCWLLALQLALPLLAQQQQGGCKILAFLHLPKCAGTSIRNYFERRGWHMPHYCSTLKRITSQWTRRRDPDRFSLYAGHPRWFIEVHCLPHLPAFVEALPSMRSHAAINNCSFSAATILREPAGMAASDFDYFSDQRIRQNLTRGEWFRAHREMLLLGSNTHLRMDLDSKIAAVLNAARRGDYGATIQHSGGGVALARLETARRALESAESAVHAVAQRKDERGKSADVECLIRARQHADRVHGDWLGLLMSLGVLPCELVASRTHSLLGELNVVGTTERMRESLALMIQSVGLGHEAQLKVPRTNLRRPRGPQAPDTDELLQARSQYFSCSHAVYAQYAAHLQARLNVSHADHGSRHARGL